ncbi:MAG: T9SS type A sorting domain-containing protein [Phycisphaerae bacterium]|nr:T9SS type A sorting domain-containing protein [Saprospiraceae bacterium]
MKKTTFLVLCLFLSKLQAQQSGALDTTFADHGLRIVDRKTVESNLAFTVQPDGKVVAVGFTEEAGVSKFTVIRYLPDGSLDPIFASNGVFETTFFPPSNVAQAVTLQADGKILVAGYTTNGQSANLYNDEMVVLRLDVNGVPDVTFGTSGAVILSLGYNERPVSIRVLSNGRILVAGNVFHGTVSNIFVTKLSNIGNVDVSFGTNGLKQVAISNGLWNYCQDMELQPDGKILLTGEAKTASGTNFALIRLNSDGGLDPTFSGDGKATNNISPTDDGAQAMLLMPDGKIVLGGYALDANGKTEIALTRFNSNGSVDNSFGNGGNVLAQMGTDYGAVADLCLTGMGNIIVAGTAKRYPSYFDFFLAKYKPDGSLDNSFGDQGITYTDYDGHYDGISDAEILPDGKILVAGTGVNTSNSISEYLLARYWFSESSGTEDIVQVVASAWAYPNPTRERKVTLSYNLLEAAEVSLDLFSMNGNLLGSLSKFDQAVGKQKESVTLPSGLPAGAYLIGLRAGDKQTFVKIIVQ